MSDEDPAGLKIVVCAFMFVMGFVSFGYEVTAQAEAVMYLGSSNIAMGVVISMFVLGYLTSLPFGIRADKSNSRKELFFLYMLLGLLIGVIMIFTGNILSVAPGIGRALSSIPVAGGIGSYAYLLITISVLVAIVPALMGGLMPVAMKLLSGTSEEAFGKMGSVTGTLFSLDSLGSALGGMVTAVYLLSTLGKDATSLLIGSICLFFVVVFSPIYLLSSRIEFGSFGSFGSPGSLRTLTIRSKAFLRKQRWKLVGVVVIATVLSSVLVNLNALKYGGRQGQYEGVVIFYEETPYNTIAVTKHPELDTVLYQGKKIVYSDKDHFQLYEPMVHVPMMSFEGPERVLVLGGGNGGALSEVLKYPGVEQVVVVEKDEVLVETAVEFFQKVQNTPFDDPRVRVVNEFPGDFLRDQAGPDRKDDTGFDVVIADLLEPRNIRAARNYTVEFYRYVRQVLRPGGKVVTAASSPVTTPRTGIVIKNTMEAAFGHAALFGTDTWSSGPYLFCIASVNSSAVTFDEEIIERNYANLTRPTGLYSPENHQAFFLSALTNEVLEMRDDKTVSTDATPYTERL